MPSKIPPTTEAKRDAGLLYSVKMLNGYGITGIQDASVDEDDLKTYRRLDDARALHVQAKFFGFAQQIAAPRQLTHHHAHRVAHARGIDMLV